MKASSFRLYALFICCVAIAACSQTTELTRFQFTPSVNSAPDRGAGPLSYRVLHSFGARHGGDSPIAGLIDVGDTFYGTTAAGGLYGGGTVFSITTSGAEKTLHSFGKGPHGRQPYGALVNVNGTLYGTTIGGGAFGDGTVFSIATDGSVKVLHSFGKGTDAKYPQGNLIDVGGTLYGTSSYGGDCATFKDGCGTVFSITTGGREKVLYNFGKRTDGLRPDAGLIDVGGLLYGTTFSGGKYAGGTVFRMTTGGMERVLHDFGKGYDGADPAGDLIDVKGTLYGTTNGGGPYDGSGTVFSITRSGSEGVLHYFGKGNDGAAPGGGLIYINGTFYGTTVGGGKYRLVSGGTVFSITKGGTEKVLHDFGKGTDGWGPLGNLIYEGGSLFGTTQGGGGGHDGAGTVFSLTP